MLQPTNKDLYNLFGLPERTFYRRVKELQEDNKFKKQSKGYRYKTHEALLLSDLLGYKHLFVAYLQKYLQKKITAIEL